jgi:hypothetical protein
VAALLEAVDEGFRIDALDRLLAGRIDGGDHDDIGVVEGAWNSSIRSRGGIAVRLHDTDHPPSGALARGGQHALDLAG